jgi:hypothetical protein
MEMLGVPPVAILKHAARRRSFFEPDRAPRVASMLQRSLGKVSEIADQQLLDFLQTGLIWDPERRITAEHVPNHPF